MRTEISGLTKKLLAMVTTVIMLIGATMFIGSTTVYAANAETAEVSDDKLAAHLAVVEEAFSDVEDGYELISEITTQEDGDMLATTRIYARQEAVTYSSDWTYKHFKAERVYTESLAEFPWVKIYVEGDFRWDGETAYVSNEKGDAVVAHNPSTITIKDKTEAEGYSDCGSNFLFGNKYAYIEISATAINNLGTTIDYSLELVVNRKGKAHTNPSGGDITSSDI